VGIDSTSPSVQAALGAVVDHFDPAQVAVVAPAGSEMPLAAQTPFPQGVRVEHLERALVNLSSIGAVVACGDYLPAGSLVHRLARQRDIPSFVVQHGLLTPLAPPLPSGAHLLAWTEEDASFWCADRSDVESTVVGSRLLWEAARGEPVRYDMSKPPAYLGQLHGAELPRRQMAYAASSFCRTTGATYRPHPSEHDVRSRWQHRSWAREGIQVAHATAMPLAELGTSVVGVFSTGVIEAAALGLPAFVAYPQPPAWLREFWGRYRLSIWGGEPTPKPEVPATDPALAIARILGP
jgi:hypothetical protein